MSDTEISDIGLPAKHFRSEGPSIVEALKAAAAEGGFEIITDPAQIDSCDIVLLCVGEIPYAEWYGDTKEPSLTGAHGITGNAEAITLAKNSGKPTVTLIVAGRNVMISKYIDQWDACIMLYLPGTEGGNAVVDVLTQKVQMTGTLPMPYYSSVDQIGTAECWHDIGWNAYKG